MSGPTYELGLDEAGYGPVLGPLMVGCVRVRGPVGALARAMEGAEEGFPQVADSKVLHRGAGGLARLERTALAALGLARGRTPCRASEVLADEGVIPADAGHPWYAGLRELALPLVAPRDEVSVATERLEAGLARAGARMEGASARALFEGPFNEACARLGTKAAAELELIDRALDAALPEAGEVEVRVDRLGGRKHYGEWLAQRFCFAPIAVVEEARERSRYEVQEAGRRLLLCFEVKADSHHPVVALASVLAKYGREVCMHAYNAFWTARVPGLTATAGYPEDARRFIAAVGADPLWRAHEARLVRHR